MSDMFCKPGAPYGLPAASVGDRAPTRNLGPSGPRGFKSQEEIESLDETLAYLSDTDEMNAIRESIRDVEEGRVEVLTEEGARARWAAH